MWLPAGLLLLSGALSVASGLTVTLKEGEQSIPISDSPRSISLVPDHVYTIECEGVWFQNGSQVTATSGPVHTTTDGSSLVLHFEPFAVQLEGEYVCEDSGSNATLRITADNPVIIASRLVIGVEKGSQQAAQFLRVFGSGTPQPMGGNYSWTLDGEPLDEDNYVSVEPTRVFLELEIGFEVGGLYRNVLTTSAGERAAEIQLNVEVVPVPQLTVSPRNYTDEMIAIGESITFNCSDSQGIPAPSLSWTLDGSLLVEDERHLVSYDERQTQLTISPVEEEDDGVVVRCTAQSVVQDELRTEHVELTLDVLAPPLPPTNLSAEAFSNCEVALSWLPPPPPPNGTLPAEYFIIEARVEGSNGSWDMIGSRVPMEETSRNVKIINSQGMLNVSYVLRLRSGNRRGGDAQNSTMTEPVVLYYYPLPPVSSLVATPLSSPPTSVRLGWELGSASCVRYSSHKVSCGAAGTGMTVEGGATAGNVTGLGTDQRYTCSVLSQLEDLNGTSFMICAESGEVEAFTYPSYPEPPATPTVADSAKPSATNITVIFALSPDPVNISHYQVIVLRLRSSKELPDAHPDQLYPADFQFSTDVVVNDRKIDKPISGPYIAAEIAAEDFSPTFVIGSGRATGPNKNYTNGPLVSSSGYSCFLRAFPKSFVLLGEAGKRRRRNEEEGKGRQYAVFNSSDFLPVQETADMPSPERGSTSLEEAIPGIAAGAVIAAAIVAFIVVTIIIFLLCRCQRRNKFTLTSRTASFSSSKDSMDIPEPATPDLCRKTEGLELNALNLVSGEDEDEELVPSGAVPVNMFREHVEKFDENRQLLFQHEFDWIQANALTYPSEASNNPINDEKNRYSNIIAYDHSRVTLTPKDGVEGSDYINANYIPGYKRTREYISTQGPLEQTVADFWRMVWEQNSATVVMLTNLVELGKVKCSQYWPSQASLTCGDIEVKLDSVVELRDYTIRNFTVTHIPSGDFHSVLQFHYTKWPDYGTPKLAAPLLNFLRAVHTSNPPEAGPIIVHCSAGVGRSGTVITIDYCLQQLKADHVIDVRGFVSRMREHRNYMVQTEMQYAFIHYAILEAITYGDTSFPLSNFSLSYQHLQQKNKESGQTLLEEEYARLGSIKTMSKRSTFVQRVKQKGPTNRSIHYPGHSSYSEGGSPHEYNAHFIDAYFTPKLFIIADGPEESNAAKFWQMVWDQDCAYIIMLTPLDAHYYSYWPGKNESETFGNIKVTVEEEMAEHYYTTRVIRISNSKVIGISQTVTQYQFVGLTTQYLPPVPTFVSFICDVLKGVETLQKNQKALVHDMKSLGPSGIFCSLCFCIERIRVERMVDVFQAVQNIQLQRPGTLESMQQYAFVYDCVYEFIRTHSNT